LQEEQGDTSWATMYCTLVVSKEIHQQTQTMKIPQSYLSNWSKWSRNPRRTDALLILTTPFVRKYSATRMNSEKTFN
jgi:hypothetical protein